MKPAEAENAIVQTKERGPVQVTLRVEPKEPSFADRIHFTIAAVSERGVDVTLPPPETLGGFLIKDHLYYPPKETQNGALESSQSYILEVVTSGEYSIPRLETSFVDNRERLKKEEEEGESVPPLDDEPAEATGGEESDTTSLEEPKVFKIVSDPMTIHVKSLEDVAALELRPIAPPVEPPVVPLSLKWPLILGGSLLAAAAGTVLLVYLLRRREAKAPPPVPPEELAYRELEWLIAQKFMDQGELKEFFFHLSRIVREYIERRFGLRAPEMTTEEFLQGLAFADLLDSQHKRLLGQFLERADLVKFARYDPPADEIEGSFEAAKVFISETCQQREEVVHGVR